MIGGSWPGVLKYRAVIFDLDGTLLDTIGDIADSANAVLESMGLPAHPLENYHLFVGDGIAMLAERALPAGLRDPGTVAKAAGLIGEEYGKRWSRTTVPYRGVPELIASLRDRGVGMSVLSNKPHDFTVLMVRHYFPENPFAFVLGLRPGVPRKPDPAAALEIARGTRIEPAGTVLLGDSGGDMRTAAAAGMYPAGAAWGYRGERELLECGAMSVLARPEDLEELFGIA